MPVRFEKRKEKPGFLGKFLDNIREALVRSYFISLERTTKYGNFFFINFPSVLKKLVHR